MKILSLLNQSFKNIVPQNSYAQNLREPLQYAYNLNFDTVSFEGRRNKKIESDDDDWIDECNMNSDAILKHLQNNSFDQVLNFVENLDEKEWDPNFCLFDNENGNHSLMGIVLIKMGDLPSNSEKYEDLRKIAQKIASHKDFKYINESVDEDTLFTALATYNPETAIDIMYSDNFQAHLDKINFDKYISLAYEGNLTGVLEELKAMQSGDDSIVKIVGGGGEQSSKVDNDLKNMVEARRIKANLRKYEVIQNPNDPKSLDEVGGMFQAKKDIEEFIIKPWNKDFRDKIIENKLNRPSGFLLSGPPGCGKTYIMKAIAAQTGYDLYEVNLANIGDSAGYKTQNDMKQLFDNLEEIYKLTGEPSIVILDELDSIAMSRQNCQTDWKKDDINALLMVINNSAQRGVIVVGATNDPDSLDDAVKRSGRLDKHIEIGLPDYEETKDIVEKILSDRPIAAELAENSEELARKLKGMSPADISSILHNACLNAIYEYKDAADMDDFEKMFEALKHKPKDKGRTVIKGFRAYE